MVSRLRLCRATQSARALASATVPIASTSTASYSPKIKVDVIGSKPSASPKGFGRSPTIVLPGAVKTFTLRVFKAAVRLVFETKVIDGVHYHFEGTYMADSGTDLTRLGGVHLEGSLTKLINSQSAGATKIRL